MEYPKSLYLKGWDDLTATVVVCNPEEEASARKSGYKMLSEPVEATRPRKARAQ